MKRTELALELLKLAKELSKEARWPYPTEPERVSDHNLEEKFRKALRVQYVGTGHDGEPGKKGFVVELPNLFNGMGTKFGIDKKGLNKDFVHHGTVTYIEK